METPVYVTKPFLPPLAEFQEYLVDIWESRNLTNGAKYHQLLESQLAEYLGVKYISLFANATLALISAIRSLHISGEVITTPFSFIATAHALWWNGIKPVFVDIDPLTLDLDPDRIEAALTPKTTAILPVHVYGNPCNVVKIGEIAGRYGLRVIYDGAPAFGVTLEGKSVLSFGDLSVLSFHATKVFTTFEGGAIISHDAGMKKRIDNMKNFGFVTETSVVSPGINAKMNELQAALGLLQLKYVDRAIALRKDVATRYRKKLEGVRGISMLSDPPGAKGNSSYFPILVDEQRYGSSRNALYEKLKARKIFARRYYYPLISQFPTYSGLESSLPGRMPVAEKAANEILCLPIYPDLDAATIDFICGLIEGNE